MLCPYKGKFKVSQKFKGSSHDGLDLVGLESKNIYSTIDGTVEKAGWENVNDKTQGFGLYVRILKKGSADKYYFGHLSDLKVKTGDTVKKGDLIGTEGSTGKSTGSHCHYCARKNGLKAAYLDICEISGIPNVLGEYTSVWEETKKTNEEIAKEVLAGKWGNGTERKTKLIAAGYDYSVIQQLVNELLSPTKKTNTEIAKEVIAGKWGNGTKRKKNLTDAGYDFAAIQKLVNEILKGE